MSLTRTASEGLTRGRAKKGGLACSTRHPDLSACRRVEPGTQQTEREA